ncbi:MAG: hypothetical protein WCJ62_13760 [Flavobacterium sp.]
MLSFFKSTYLKVLAIALIILFSFVYGVSHFMQYTLGVENLKKSILEKEQLIKGLKLSNDSLSNFISTQKDAMLAKDNLIEFFKLKDFKGDYRNCEKILLLNWIKLTYKVE